MVREQLKLWRLFWESRHLECPESGLARSVEDHRSRCCRKCLRYFETEDGAPEAEVRASGRRCGMEQAETCTAHRVWLLAQHYSICKRSYSSWANKNVRMMREVFLFLLWKIFFFKFPYLALTLDSPQAKTRFCLLGYARSCNFVMTGSIYFLRSFAQEDKKYLGTGRGGIKFRWSSKNGHQVFLYN